MEQVKLPEAVVDTVTLLPNITEDIVLPKVVEKTSTIIPKLIVQPYEKECNKMFWAKKSLMNRRTLLVNMEEILNSIGLNPDCKIVFST